MIDRVRELTRAIDLERLEAALNALRRAIAMRDVDPDSFDA